jgi:serine/threonine protein phosphatase PrpC
MNIATLLRRKPRTAAPCPATAFRSESRTHVGRVRTINEDRLLERPDRGLWAVADGMGGHDAGAAAAAAVIDALAALADCEAPLDEAAVRAALTNANRTIRAREGQANTTSGATVVVLLIHGMTATICWAGDSRVYRVRGGRVERLTRDHSIVQEMVDAGVLTEEAAERHPRANVITRALGVAPTVDLECVTTLIGQRDRLLLCSDGVSRSLTTRDFTSMPTSIGSMADRLLANALQRDGSDNATLIVIDAEDLEPAQRRFVRP